MRIVIIIIIMVITVIIIIIIIIIVITVIIIIITITIAFRASFFVWAYLSVLMYIGVKAYEFILTPGNVMDKCTCN